MDLSQVGRALVLVGMVIVAVGMVLVFADRVPFLGRLPGDIRLGGDDWAVYLPIGTSILLSVLLSLVFGLLARWNRG
jgi:hypothetical protein